MTKKNTQPENPTPDINIGNGGKIGGVIPASLPLTPEQILANFELCEDCYRKILQKVGTDSDIKHTIEHVGEEIVAAVKENTKAREDDVFQGTHRANARCHDDVSEIEIETVARLRKDGWKWKDVVKQVYPDCPEEDIVKEADRLRLLYRRASGREKRKCAAP